MDDGVYLPLRCYQTVRLPIPHLPQEGHEVPLVVFFTLLLVADTLQQLEQCFGEPVDLRARDFGAPVGGAEGLGRGEEGELHGDTRRREHFSAQRGLGSAGVKVECFWNFLFWGWVGLSSMYLAG